MKKFISDVKKELNDLLEEKEANREMKLIKRLADKKILSAFIIGVFLFVTILDEFNNIPEISNLEKMLAIGGSKNIKFNLTLQRIGQLKRKYGERYKQILSNCTNKFYLCSSDIETVEYFYEEIGYLKNKMQLMNLKEDELLIVRSNKRDCNNKIEPYPIYNKAENTYKYEYEK